MGTNYYLFGKQCPTCLRSDPPLHIGKSGAGWAFSLHVIPEKDIHNLFDWIRLFLQEDKRIEDEYGRHMSTEDMLRIIMCREKTHAARTHTMSDEELRKNHAFYSKHGLLTPLVDGHRCVGEGYGTWSLIAGEFS